LNFYLQSVATPGKLGIAEWKSDFRIGSSALGVVCKPSLQNSSVGSATPKIEVAQLQFIPHQMKLQEMRLQANSQGFED
jgi:hypothetical protein